LALGCDMINVGREAMLRNFPIVGHFRYLLEAVGPELRQYIVTSNNDERPFSRDQVVDLGEVLQRAVGQLGHGPQNRQ
jgi:hypothetical protein